MVIGSPTLGIVPSWRFGPGLLIAVAHRFVFVGYDSRDWCARPDPPGVARTVLKWMRFEVSWGTMPG